jgi:serine/threonine protein kinase/tetratricopeptide (TPR) repeat protein
MRRQPPDQSEPAGTVQRALAPAQHRRQRLLQPRLQRVVGDRYLLVRELGQGGFGVVWEARDLERARPCCIKFLWPELGRGFSLVRFKREFRTARRLAHPACVDVYDLDHTDNLWFFSMEFVTGSSLRDAAALRGDVRAVAAIGLQILAALDQLHSKSIVHRDLKPHNILVAPAAGPNTAPVAKLTDFGIAKVGDLDDNETVRSLWGSPPYLPPELLLEGVADARCDLYSLGVSLYQTLTGRHPLGSPPASSGWPSHIKTSEPTPLAAVAPEVPDAVGDVIMRLCAKDPAARFRSAAQAYDRLGDWLAHQTDYEVPRLPPLVGAPYLAAPRLIGRDRERARIEEFLTANLDPAEGQRASPLLLLSGPAGVGKSRLLSWLVRSTRQHTPIILAGQCRSEIGAPFEVVTPILAGLRRPNLVAELAGGDQTMTHQAFDGFSDMGGTETATRPLLGRQPPLPDTASPGSSGPSESPLSSADPSSVGTTARSSPGEKFQDDQGLRQLLTSMTDQLLRAVENRPTLIVIEDLQWSDFETLELIKLWTRSVVVDRSDGRRLPVALVATHRPVADGAPLHALARDLGSEGRAITLELETLPAAANVELAAELLMCPVDEALRDACRRLWGDHPSTPLYISQVLRLILARGLLSRPGHHWAGEWDFSRLPSDVQRLIPATVEDAIGERASRFSIETKALLSLAAVFGRRFALAPLSQAAQLDSALAHECLEEAERAGFVSEPAGEHGDGSFAFTHDRFREALYRALSPEQQRHLHGVVGATMLSRSTTKGRDVAVDLALHFDRADDRRRAYRFSVLAGEQAFRARQYSRASDLFAQAVKHADALGRKVPYRLLCRLGDAAALVLHVTRAEAAYQRALERTTNRNRRLELLTRLGELHDRTHNSAIAVDYYTRALDTGLPWYLRGAVTAWLLILLMFVLVLIAPPSATVPYARCVLSQVPRRRREALHHCALAASIRAGVHGRVGAWLRFGITIVLTGLADGRQRAGSSFGVAIGSMQSFFGFMAFDGKFRAWDAMHSRWQEDQSTDNHRFGLYITRGSGALFLAREAEAVRDLQQAFTIAERRKDPRLMEMAGFTLIGAYRAFARRDEAWALVQKLRRFAEAENLSSLQSTNQCFEIGGLLDQGHYARAIYLFAELRSRSDSIDAKDQLTTDLTRYYDLQARYCMDGPSETITREVLDVLRACDREPPTVPVVSVSALLFTLAAEMCAQLKRQGQLPADLAARLARARRRPRPIDGRGRWRRGKWLVGYSIYDAMQGKERRARRQLDAGLVSLTRFENRYAYGQCRAGQRGFAPGSDLAERCTAVLDELYARRPEMRGR